MAHNEVLEAADIAGGYILACQAVPLTPRSALATEAGTGGGPAWHTLASGPEKEEKHATDHR